MNSLEKQYDNLHDCIAGLSFVILILVITACIKGFQLDINRSTIGADIIMTICVVLIGIISTFLIIPTWIKIRKLRSKYKKKLKELEDDIP